MQSQLSIILITFYNHTLLTMYIFFIGEDPKNDLYNYGCSFNIYFQLLLPNLYKMYDASLTTRPQFDGMNGSYIWQSFTNNHVQTVVFLFCGIYQTKFALSMLSSAFLRNISNISYWMRGRVVELAS